MNSRRLVNCANWPTVTDSGFEQDSYRIREIRLAFDYDL